MTVDFNYMLLICCILFISLAGCQKAEKPDDLIPESKYTDLLMEVYLTQHRIEFKEQTEKSDSVMTDLFDRYGVTKEQFERSHNYYQIDANAQKKRIDKIRKKLRDEQTRIDEARQKSRKSDPDQPQLRSQPESEQQGRPEVRTRSRSNPP